MPRERLNTSATLVWVRSTTWWVSLPWDTAVTFTNAASQAIRPWGMETVRRAVLVPPGFMSRNVTSKRAFHPEGGSDRVRMNRSGTLPSFVTSSVNSTSEPGSPSLMDSLMFPETPNPLMNMGLEILLFWKDSSAMVRRGFGMTLML